MAKKNKIYRCEICGNIVQVVHSGKGTLVCCGKDMTQLEERNVDEGLEKHVPVIEINENKAVVKVGSVAHPMEESHYIEFIQLVIDGNIYTKYLKPGELSEVTFDLPENYSEIYALEYCNIHGLWSSK